jgi:hypothetical protein
MTASVRDERTRLGRSAEPCDVAVFAFSEPGPSGSDTARDYEKAGATWWLESLSPMRGSVVELMDRIEDGPPR